MNMKHIRRYSSVMAAAAILCLASCKKEGEMVTLKVQFEQGAAQKIYLGEGNTVNWFPDEEVTINNENYTIANAAVTVSASSSGYTAVYPAATGMTAAGGNVNFPSTQDYVEVSDAEGNKYQKLEAPMVAYLSAEKGTLMFRNAGSLLRVRVVNPSSTQSFHLEYICVQAANSNISGTLPVTFNGSTTTRNITLGSISNGSKAVRLNVNENLAAGASKDYYLMLAPLHEHITINMVGTENGGSRKNYEKASPTVVTLGRSVIGTVRMENLTPQPLP